MPCNAVHHCVAAWKQLRTSWLREVAFSQGLLSMAEPVAVVSISKCHHIEHGNPQSPKVSIAQMQADVKPSLAVDCLWSHEAAVSQVLVVNQRSTPDASLQSTPHMCMHTKAHVLRHMRCTQNMSVHPASLHIRCMKHISKKEQ